MPVLLRETLRLPGESMLTPEDVPPSEPPPHLPGVHGQGFALPLLSAPRRPALVPLLPARGG